MELSRSSFRGFTPYALAALLIGLVGGFSTLLGPAFVLDIGIAYSNTTWTALAQAMSTAVCAPILGKLADVLGRKRTLLAGIAVFTLGNALTATADSLSEMLVARLTVGIGTAAIAPVVMAYIVTEFPPERVGQGFAAYMLISSASVIFGPLLGGAVIAERGWRAMIWLCTAIGAATFLLCLITGRREALQRRPLGNFDWAGALWLVIFFSLVLCIPSFGQNFGWRSRLFLTVLAGAIPALAGLLLAEKRAKNPILPGSFLGRRVFVLSVAGLFLTQGLMQANMTNLIIFVNHTQPANTMVSSYAISVMYLGMSLGAVVLGPLADRKEPRAVLCGSFLLTGVSCGLLLLFSTATPPVLMMVCLGLLGLGLGGNGTIFMKVALTGLAPEAAGAGTGTYGLFRDLAAPFGVAIFVPMFTNRIALQMALGESGAQAAVTAVHALALAQLLCIAIGICVVLCLPKIHTQENDRL